MLIYILIFLYLSFIIVLIWIYQILKADYYKILWMISFELEKIWYQFTKKILWSKIYKYDEAIKVLFDNKKKFINWKHYTITDFENLYNNYIKDIDYLGQLTNKDVASELDIFQIPFEDSRIIQNYFAAVRKFLQIFTIWIASLFIRWKKIC